MRYYLLGPDPLFPTPPHTAFIGVGGFPVVERDNPQKLLGIVSLGDLLKARTRNLEEERQRERILRLRLLTPRRARSTHQIGE